MTATASLIYFSPTGTTRTIVSAIARGLGAAEISHHDLTPPGNGMETAIAGDVAIIGVPVYAGRVPELFLERFTAITATGTPAVLVALYGNREFEDALVELRDVASAQGFRIMAAAAFIGEHSYSTPRLPVAVGRPDADDVALAEAFGRQVAAKLERGDLSCPVMEGNVPYRQRMTFGGIAPETDPAKCTLCGACSRACPAGLIDIGDSVSTRAEHCFLCCACTRACGFDARHLLHPVVEEKRAMLAKNCSTPKAPKTFL